jgi:hypothetical protein
VAGPSQPLANPLAWWGIIQASTSERMTTAEVWSAIHSYSQAHAIAEPPGLFQAVNSLRASAAGLRDTGTAFLRAPDGNALDVRYVAQLPYARPLADQNVMQRYAVKITYLAEGAHGIDTRSVTLSLNGQDLPATVGGLSGMISEAVAAYADKYDETSLGVDQVEIGAW